MLKYFKRDYVTDFNAAFTNKYKSYFTNKYNSYLRTTSYCIHVDVQGILVKNNKKGQYSNR